MRRFSRAQRIVFRIPPYDTPRAARYNKAKFRVHRRHTAGGVCEQRITALRKYRYRYRYTNIAESRIERDYWPRFARYAHAARQLYDFVYICQDGGAVGFVEFTKLLFALSSLAQPFDQMVCIPEYVFVILSQRKAYAGRFQKETVGKRTGPMTKWPPRRPLFTRLEIVFVTISPFTKRTKVDPKVFQEGERCLEGLINLACGL